MEGRVATKRLERPPAPMAAAWQMEFSWGPKVPPRMGMLPKLLDMILRMPKPKMAPRMLEEKVKPVFRPVEKVCQ